MTSLKDILPSKHFKLPVLLPIPGAEPYQATFTVKHRTLDELKELTTSAEAMTDEQIFGAIVVDWEFSEEFNPENVKRLLYNLHAASRAVTIAYLQAYQNVREVRV
jgi:hypothetical protein